MAAGRGFPSWMASQLDRFNPSLFGPKVWSYGLFVIELFTGYPASLPFLLVFPLDLPCEASKPPSGSSKSLSSSSPSECVPFLFRPEWGLLGENLYVGC